MVLRPFLIGIVATNQKKIPQAWLQSRFVFEYKRKISDHRKRGPTDAITLKMYAVQLTTARAQKHLLSTFGRWNRALWLFRGPQRRGHFE